MKRKAYTPEQLKANAERAAKWRADQTPRRKKDQQLRVKFGITIERYEEMSLEQEHKCAICGQPSKAPRALAVDHCHNTGKVRGLLCGNCNLGMGKLNDSKELLMKAIMYLEKYS